MVGLWGMSEELGPVSYNVGERDPFLGREIAAPKEYAESTASRIDAAVAELLEGARERARTLLSQHRAVLDALAGELIAKETVSGVRLAEIATAVADPTAAAAADATHGAHPTEAPTPPRGAEIGAAVAAAIGDEDGRQPTEPSPA
jgi:cell division protease FtsH